MPRPATLVSAVEDDRPFLGPFVYGTDGSGGENLIVPTGGMRRMRTAETSAIAEDDSGNARSADNLYMNGAEIFNFTLTAVPDSVNKLLAKSGLSIGDVDFFVFHQANRYMLDHLRKRMKIPVGEVRCIDVALR